MKALVTAALLALAAAPLAAQDVVGYPPAESPFRDLVYRQEIGAYGGWFFAGEDRAGVAPRSGPMLGARYEVRVGGPAYFTARVARVWSERTVKDPTEPRDSNVVGSPSWPLYLGDLALTIHLTGQKSYHRLVPLVHAGVGVVSDFESADVGGFRFGTQFAFSFGGGVKWVPAEHLTVRADAAAYLYQVNYPNAFFGTAGDTTTAILPSGAQNDWTQNVALTIGVAYRFYR